MMFFLLKIAVPPALVAVMSLAARRWGPTFGGLIMGLPWMTGPVLFFLALDKGEQFAVDSCTGIEIGVVCISAFMLAYAAMTSFARWPLCLAAAVAAFAGTGWLTQGVAMPMWAATAAALASLALAYVLLPRPLTSTLPAALPAWDIPMRMLATFLLVAAIMLSADALGPRLSGIVATYPVILTVIGAFTHHQGGRDAVRRVLRALTLSLLGFVAFFLVLGSVLPALGLVASFLLAAATGLSISAALIVVNRLRGA